MSKVKYIPGVVSGKDGKQITTQQDAWAEDAKCGCGIDCCNNELVLKDKTTGDITKLYFDNGSLFVDVAGTVYEATLSEV